MTDPMNNSSPASRLKRTRETRQLYWQSIAPELLAHFINETTAAGCACLFARTRDGGTLVAQVLNGDNKLKDYIPDPHDAPIVLNWMLDDLNLLQYNTGPAQND